MINLIDDQLTIALEKHLDMFCHAHGVKLVPDKDDRMTPIVIQRNAEETWCCYQFQVRK